MKPNIGMINALIRLICGFTMLAWATARLSRRPYHDNYIFIAMLAAMKIGEGIVRFCPLTYAFNEYKEQNKDDDSEEAINPT